ncbi:DUF433 domain-containing protein [Methylosinus sp. Ce-a6]|uniref:DUF433 domain-containing protein n=1 Tax=Methylosinus sp. Ce-a6 TaxID=2172005 RepID=UPI00135CBAA1|nr:DUF433 domain-containing protein [Methylosinus sp. Ce-a6]
MSSASANTVVSAFTEDQVTRLTGISQRQLRYWASDSFYKPSIKVDTTDIDGLRLYSFRDLVCLKVINALRNDVKIPLQELRATKERLAHLGDDLWAKTTLYVLGKKVVFENPETGEKEEVSSGQGVLQIPLVVVTGQMADAVRAMRQRKDGSFGKIEQKRGIAQNQAVIAGTRIPVRSIQAFAKAGYTVEEINKQYPTLTKDDIIAAIDFKDVA